MISSIDPGAPGVGTNRAGDERPIGHRVGSPTGLFGSQLLHCGAHLALRSQRQPELGEVGLRQMDGASSSIRFSSNTVAWRSLRDRARAATPRPSCHLRIRSRPECETTLVGRPVRARGGGEPGTARPIPSPTGGDAVSARSRSGRGTGPLGSALEHRPAPSNTSMPRRRAAWSSTRAGGFSVSPTYFETSAARSTIEAGMPGRVAGAAAVIVLLPPGTAGKGATSHRRRRVPAEPPPGDVRAPTTSWRPRARKGRDLAHGLGSAQP